MNKHYFSWVLTASFLLFFAACIPDPKAENAAIIAEAEEKLTDIEWLETEKKLDKVVEGQRVEVVFKFKNVGTNPLVIKNATASCGCTVPERPEEPVMPGKEGYIKGVFNSAGFPGTNHKTIYVDANTNSTTRHNLEFTIEVDPKKA